MTGRSSGGAAVSQRTRPAERMMMAPQDFSKVNFCKCWFGARPVAWLQLRPVATRDAIDAIHRARARAGRCIIIAHKHSVRCRSRLVWPAYPAETARNPKEFFAKRRQKLGQSYTETGALRAGRRSE